MSTLFEIEMQRWCSTCLLDCQAGTRELAPHNRGKHWATPQHFPQDPATALLRCSARTALHAGIKARCLEQAKWQGSLAQAAQQPQLGRSCENATGKRCCFKQLTPACLCPRLFLSIR
jgi:hypothetical protein